VSQAFSVFLGSMKKAGASQFVASQDAKIEDTAKQLIASTAAAYEPILENYIGRKVVLEIVKDKETREYCGILKDYTDKFVTILNVPIKEEHEFNLANPLQLQVNRDLDFEVTSEPNAKSRDDDVRVDLHIRLTNNSKRPVHVCHAEGDDYSQVIDKEVLKGESIEFDLNGIPIRKAEPGEGDEPDDAEAPEEKPADEQNALPNVRLWIRANRFMDMVVPRPQGIVRHGAESIGQLNVKFFLKLTTT
jgi:hypothetical protein